MSNKTCLPIQCKFLCGKSTNIGIGNSSDPSICIVMLSKKLYICIPSLNAGFPFVNFLQRPDLLNVLKISFSFSRVPHLAVALSKSFSYLGPLGLQIRVILSLPCLSVQGDDFLDRFEIVPFNSSKL